MAPPLVYQHIGLSGFTVGTVKFDSNSIEWKDRGNIVVKSFDGDQTTRAIWTVYGVKGHLYIHFKEGKFAIFDGFSKDDFSDISPFFQEEYNVAVETANPACDGGNFGDIELDDNSMVMKSAKTGKQVFDLKLTNVSQCVLPGNNKDEVEIQFHEADTGDREEDMLVQIRLRFPTVEQADVEDRDEDAEEEETNAQIFQKKIMERGMIRSVTGNVIAEFSQDQGTFVTPRGRYAIQMYSTFMRMHGAKYDYKIKYDDIDRLFMLHRPDGVSAAVVIALAKPIRQGNQKYPYLVLQTHRMEHTMQINLSEEEIQEKYDGQLDVEMTYPMCSLVAKIFKVLSQSKVFVPKNYKSDRGDQAMSCSLKTNDGLLYPLEKQLIFIHKPTVLVRYEDIERIEFKRYIPNAHSATKNFDLVVKLKPSASSHGETKEYEFSGIDRVEYAPLFAFLTSKKLPVEKPEEDSGEKSLLEQLGEDMEEEEESEDEDYEGEAASASSSDSEEDEDGGAVMVPEPEIEKPKKSKKKVREVKGGDTPTKRKASAPVDLTDDVDSTPGPKKKARKDPKKPKAAKTAYSCFMEEQHAVMKTDHPEMKFAEVSKTVGEKWKALSAEDKEKYEGLAAADKERFSSEMASYVPSAGFGDNGLSLATSPAKGKRKREKKEKDKNAPKGASSSYIIFSTKIRQSIKDEHPEMGNKDIIRETGVRWKALSEEEKAPYEALGAADKDRFEREMAVYKAQKAEGGVAEDIEDDAADADDAEEEPEEDEVEAEGDDDDMDQSGEEDN